MSGSLFWQRLFLHRWQRQMKYLTKITSKNALNKNLQHRHISTTLQLLNQSKPLQFDLSSFPVENIRNFCIIAHVDHGKSTLADRLLEITGTIPKGNNQQVLDKLPVERERGITVKAQTASLIYRYNDQDYLLNLIDTPGHVDFHYEVSRSLAACQGVILLVDANQGVQAQTVANFYLAFEAELTIIPVLNKIDLKNAQVEVVSDQIHNLFDLDKKDILKISAKQGTGVEEVLKAVIERIPCPKFDKTKPLRAFVFDSWYDRFKGVVAHFAICDGIIKEGDRILCNSTKKNYEVTEIGIMYPDQVSTGVLFAGQVGYAMMNMKNTDEAKIGDTFYHENQTVKPLPGFKEAIPMVFAGMFPMEHSEFLQLKSAIEKLTLNDRSVQVRMDSSPVLGQGYRLGFLGLLHMEVFNQRLEQEFDASVIITAPNIAFKVKIKGEKNIKQYGSEELLVLNPCLMPSIDIITEYQEPMVNGTIISPAEYINSITELCLNHRGRLKDQSYIDDTRVLFKVLFPLSEILVDFFDKLKSLSSGYASFDYEDAGFEITDLVKVDFTLNGREVEELTLICHVSRARDMAKRVCERLKATIPRQQFVIAVQGKVNQKVIAREDIKAYRKDVTAKCYGGDITRKMKLLKSQAEGKKKLRMIGNIEIPKDAFIKILQK
ncbi:translation factor GUF1 mitochondrial [Biomphalaria glabrata]|uniref:Translation factor GUF1 homolog, mitochondrial n=1 Tax=Biomphalaria glabrata TaxID=6526 RepID=A0A9W3B8E5_BIOGL|nr:translation factor Guf1, mitochondrial-like [Biomphalaria glabrata]XP_055895715.1 translation factor Guf1, mitochondrial-like [Biomphalaria glabrata]XP_055895716.1 translation factor Guf1, mitochondrial-like [Biomphalaria glabrata]XP_055895717.1 translation factor Guf1, mitochondrial-like [Biomphalaria glabrata]XP_055895718.1 translation factor Guf1, mitochondrial-like [Biomphalaria glabrata]KAI8733997.1 translation factor GUF1; mitochondrial-like [Biomphalaria glabrata]